MLVCLDSNIVIYPVEADPVWTPKADARLKAIQTAGDTVAICDVVWLECLIKPLASGDTGVEAAFRAFFASPLVQLLPVVRSTWEHAAQIGAMFKFKPLDSVHLAAAIEHGCGLFLTADAQLGRLQGHPCRGTDLRRPSASGNRAHTFPCAPRNRSTVCRMRRPASASSSSL